MSHTCLYIFTFFAFGFNFKTLQFFILSLYHMCFNYSNVRIAIELCKD